MSPATTSAAENRSNCCPCMSTLLLLFTCALKGYSERKGFVNYAQFSSTLAPAFLLSLTPVGGLAKPRRVQKPLENLLHEGKNTVAQTWSESFIEVAGGQVELLSGGSGEPLIVLHYDIGNPGWIPFYEALAEQFTVYVPSHPGYGKSDRPDWMRNVRDLAIVHQWLVKELKLDNTSLPSLVGLGFGG